MTTKTIYLLPDYTLTLTADASGVGTYVEPGAANSGTTAIGNDDVIVLGPFAYLKSYEVVTSAGTITPVKAFQNGLGFGADGGDEWREFGSKQVLRILNSTGGDLSAGDAVYISGETGGVPTIDLADASAEGTSPAVLMLLAEDVADAEFGFAATSGQIVSIDTSAHTVGDILYLSETAGELTSTAPTRSITVAQVVTDSATDGILNIDVDLQPTGTGDDFDFTGQSDNDFLQYEVGSGKWEPYTMAGTTDQITVTFGTNTTTLALPQDIASTSSPTFAALTVNGNITVTGTVDGVDVAALQTDVDGFPDELKNLTAAEIGQLENIDANTISNTQWGYVGSMDQAVATTDNVTYAALTITSNLTVTSTTLGFYGTSAVTQRTDPTALTNNMSDTTTDGTLEDVSNVSGFANAAAVERNLSELNAQINALRTILSDLGLTT